MVEKSQRYGVVRAGAPQASSMSFSALKSLS
jgi:hypothetical protein